MIAIDNNLIEKVKLFNLGKSHIRKDFSFDFTPEIFDYEKEKFDSLLNDDKEKLFTVKISKLDLSYIGNYLPGRLLEMEWAEENAVLLRMVNQPNTTSIYKMLTQVKLGKSIPLRFQDFQLSFMIKIGDLIAWTNTEDKSISDLIANVNSTKEDKDNLWESYPEYIEKISTTSERYISQDFSLENFLFSADRIERYCTAIDDPDSLDFVLTYRNNDILQAIKDGTLKEYLQSSAAVKIKKKSIPFALSLQYPSYLLENYRFLLKLLHFNSSINNVDMFLNELRLALNSRKEVRLCHCQRVLEKCIKNQDMESSLLKLEENLTKAEILTAKEKAEALDRPFIKDKSKLEKRWNVEDLIRYMASYGPLIEKSPCETVISFVMMMRNKKNQDLFAKIEFERADQSSINDCKFLQNIQLVRKYLFELAKPNDMFHAEYNSGTFAQYFYEATWDDNDNQIRLITSMANRSLRKQEKIYSCYLKINMFLEVISIRFSCLPTINEKISTVIRSLADIELHSLRALLNNGNSISPFSMNSGMYQLMPEAHLYELENFEKNKIEAAKRKAEQDKHDAEIKQKTQKEIFTNLNHSIKNLIMSVTKTLDRAKMEELSLPVRRMINRASQGADLISSIARAISLSYRESGGAWKKDINGSSDASPMNQIILAALFHSVPNILSGDNLANYRHECELYFPNKDDFELAEKEWFQASSASLKKEWINKFLFPLQLDLDNSLGNLLIDDEYATTTNFLILFNEIFLNTIKALAYVNKESRECNIRISVYNNVLIVDLKNSACSDQSQKKNGFGHIIIENYRKMFDIKIFNEQFDTREKKYKLHFELPLV